MKNLHVIPTPNPSRLLKQNNNKLILSKQIVYSHISKHLENINQNIYITNSEETKEGDCCLDKFNQIWKLENKKLIAFDSQGIKRFSTHNILGHEPKKIILTTDAYLIKDGVQDIPDEFLEWFVNNQSCEEVEIRYCKGVTMEGNSICKIIIPIETQDDIVKNYLGDELKKYENVKTIIFNKPEESKQENCCTPIGQIKRYINCKGCDRKPKQETLEEAAVRLVKETTLYGKQEASIGSSARSYFETELRCVLLGAKWQQEQDRSYSEEEVNNLISNILYEVRYDYSDIDIIENNIIKLFEQFKKK